MGCSFLNDFLFWKIISTERTTATVTLVGMIKEIRNFCPLYCVLIKAVKNMKGKEIYNLQNRHCLSSYQFCFSKVLLWLNKGFLKFINVVICTYFMINLFWSITVKSLTKNKWSLAFVWHLSLALSYWHLPLKYLYILIRSPLGLLSSRLNSVSS